MEPTKPSKHELAILKAAIEIARAEVDEANHHPRPVGMRIEKISERDAEKLFEAARTTPDVVLRLRCEPRRLPLRDHAATTS